MSGQSGPVSWRLDGRVAVITVSHPPANALGQPVLDGLRAALDAFDAADGRVLVLAAGLCQLSGAALTEILRCADGASALPLEAGLARESGTCQRAVRRPGGPGRPAGLRAAQAA